MTNKSVHQEDEVDLGSLFRSIGRGFKNLFGAVGHLFSVIYHYFISVLIFLRKNVLPLGISLLLGALIGLFLDLSQPKLYSSTMVVEPNFKSAQQLYNNINFYHELVKQKDTILLADNLKISAYEASKLKGFYIEPIKNQNEKYELFDDFIQKVDTATIKKIDFKEFKRNFTDYDYKYHIIKVRSLDKNIFEKLSFPIISSIQNNNYFKNLKKINDENLTQNEKVLVKSLQAVDTLRKIYNEVLITEAKKAESSTNITLAQGAKKTDEIELFSESLKLNRDLVENNQEKAETMDILNVVSTFSKVGVKERSIFKMYTFIIGIAFFFLMLLLILLKRLNTFLTNYIAK
jgi:hypothetical protein